MFQLLAEEESMLADVVDSVTNYSTFQVIAIGKSVFSQFSDAVRNDNRINAGIMKSIILDVFVHFTVIGACSRAGVEKAKKPFGLPV